MAAITFDIWDQIYMPSNIQATGVFWIDKRESELAPMCKIMGCAGRFGALHKCGAAMLEAVVDLNIARYDNFSTSRQLGAGRHAPAPVLSFHDRTALGLT